MSLSISFSRWAQVSWLAAWLSLGMVVGPAAAQTATVNLGDELSAGERDKLYQSLRLQVAEFQRQHAIIKTLTRLASPSVVHIDAESTETSAGRARSRTVQEAGSGVVIEHKGAFYVLTNRHVVKSASLANITLRFADGAETHPTRIWSDEQTDIAVLATSLTNLTPTRVGSSAEVEIGDFVVAMGSPFGLSHSVTYGIVSAKGRRDLELGEGGVQYQDFIQTDAAINPGNSGGPLFNLQAEVIGINTAIASSSGGSEGIGFAIPIDMAMPIVKQLIEKGTVTRAKLGVTLDSKFTHDMAREIGLPRLVGARIIKLLPGSAAESAGLRNGDVVLRFGGVTIDNDTHLVNVISVAPIGPDIPVDVLRDRKMTQVKVRLTAP